jgi:hypothetical protein
MLSPLCLATAQNKIEFIRFMHQFNNADSQRDLNLALFLANRGGFEKIASLLLAYGAKPGQASSANGLHGAAWCGLTGNISDYVNNYGASPDVADGSSATPIIYAILGTQDEERAWLTIDRLISLGASPLLRFGSKKLSYVEIAQKNGKECLTQRLKEWEACYSPTVRNLSRESSCTPGEDNDLDSKRSRQDPEADGRADLLCKDNRTEARVNDQPDNKRPREDPEVDGRVKRAREA